MVSVVMHFNYISFKIKGKVVPYLFSSLVDRKVMALIILGRSYC